MADLSTIFVEVRAEDKAAWVAFARDRRLTMRQLVDIAITQYVANASPVVEERLAKVEARLTVLELRMAQLEAK